MSETKVLETLKGKRTSIRGRLTKFNNYLDSIKTEQKLCELQVKEVQLKLNIIKDLSLDFEQLQSQIEELCLDTIDKEIDERDATESKFCLLIARAETLLKPYILSECSRTGSYKSSASDVHEPPHEASFKLPTIQIAKFDGNYSKWLEFRDTFESLIHDSNQLLPIHKFHYLNSYLIGEAGKLLTNLEVSSDNYEEAWNLL
ncbi:hypothetical protein NE865_09298 [Phthorimaea operculella]|nr:hypothetical protein NE865_09298 [Phthorimaea operculella]